MNADTTTPTPTATAGSTDANVPVIYLNPTSRLHKWVCSCTQHLTNINTGRTKSGPYVIRLAGTGALISCGYCSDFFRIADMPPTRRLSRGCAHCDNPEAHVHEPTSDA